MRILALLVLLLLPFVTPGCVVAIGNEGEESVDERVKELEKRMEVIEERLGIPPAQPETAAEDAAK
jgi:hypothetical protein